MCGQPRQTGSTGRQSADTDEMKTQADPNIPTSGQATGGCLTRLVILSDVPEMPRSVAREIAKIDDLDWLEDDWRDLLRLQRIMRHNLATRHGLLKQDNISAEGSAVADSRTRKE